MEMGRDVYYKIEGPAIGMPAPVTADNETFYPRYNFESRVLLWVANQQHLYYGSFVLAVPIFCMCIEFAGMISKDKAMARKYDQLAYDFIRISLTAYSLTAILGCDSDLYLPDSLSILFWILVWYFPPGHAHLCADVRRGKWSPLHLLLWMGQNEGRRDEVGSFEHVCSPECHRNGPDVLGQFLDCVHDVSCWR